MNAQQRAAVSASGQDAPESPPSRGNPEKGKLQLIQAFRGIAAMLVVCYHTGTLYSKNLGMLAFDNAFKFGHTGVTFFFVLSGFIIYFIHSRDLGMPERLPFFIYKRLTRIYPLYWFVLAVKLLIKPAGILAVGSALILAPVRDPVVSVSWTLSYEMLFYACFGIFIFASGGWIRALFLSLFGLVVLRTAILTTGNDPLGEYFYLSFLLSPHILEFALGGIAGYLVLKGALREWRLRILFAGLFLFAAFSAGTVIWVNQIARETAAAPYAQAELIDCYFERNAVLFFGIPSSLILLGAGLIDRFGKASTPSFFLKIGDASYSIYLVHATIVNLITLKLGSIRREYLPLTILPTIAFAILAGYAVHMIVEKPMLAFFSGKAAGIRAKARRTKP